jgi:hypothetical protein
MVKKIHKGGDGYTINVNQPIGGLPGFSRYANNYQPVFEGELLQNGGNSDCGCDTSTKTSTSPSVFNIIKNMTGGASNTNNNKLNQFSAIQKLSYLLTPLSLNQIVLLIVNTFLNILNENKPKKTKQFGGYMQQLQDIVAPLGKSNLLVLSSLLLLHYFAVENNKNHSIKSGGASVSKDKELNSSFITDLFVKIEDAFSKKQSGGNPLKNLIAPLGTNAFIATGLLIVIEKLFTSRVNEVKKGNNTKLVGGRVNKKYDKLFNLIAPITFNVFTKESHLEKFAKNNFGENK